MRTTFILSLFREDIVRALFWTLVHSLWQGMALAILTGLVILLTRRSVPALRYNILLGLFCLSLAAAGVTFFLQLRGVGAGTDAPSVVPAGIASAPSMETPVMNNLYAGVGQPWTDKLVSYLNEKADVLVAIWMVILFIRLVKLLTDLGTIQRLRYYRTKAAGEGWRQRVEELARQLGIKRAVELLESSLIQVPMMAGIFKPVILVPLGLLSQLPPQQVEAILLHELAHIRRKDYFVNLLQSVAETFFFFNPAMLWISSLIRVERENCCDDIAIEGSRSKREFIHALVAFQEYQQSSSYALAFAGSRNHLLDRVKRIVNNDNKTLNIRERLFLLISVFITAGLTMAYSRQEPTQVKQATAQVKAMDPGQSVVMALSVDTSKPVKADTVTPGQRREWERVLAEQQRRLEETQARLAEQSEELNRQQERLNDLYAEALARVQNLRDSIHGNNSPLAHLREEQLQLAKNERLLKESQLKSENQARLRELVFQRQFENAARVRDRVLRMNGGTAERMNKYVAPVIDMLQDKKLITRTDELSFSLDKDGLTVNGKKQPEEVFQDFRKAFLEDPQDYIRYLKKGGSESTSVNKHKD
ncbi:MAG: M48 family metalloprotease [Chitinophagaceae bacterium]|nr:M48 family metalloprotease [Chitinophagaceae bacterium]